MRSYRYLAFDLDGTLTEPRHGLIASFEYALKKMGVDFGERESLARYIGPPLYDEWRKDFSFTDEEATRAIALFREYFSVYGWWDNRVYDGIPELLRDLHAAGYRLMLATSKPTVFAKRIVALFGIDRYLDVVAGASTEKNHDKKWQVLEDGMNALGATPAETVLIGDRRFDAEGAAKVGCDAIGVLYGYGSEEELSAAPFVRLASTVEELRSLFLPAKI